MLNKTIVIFSTLLLPVVVSASCPQLEGRYKCEDESSERLLDFTTKLDQDVYVYSINGRTLRADGQSTETRSSDPSRSKYTTTCDAYSLNVIVELQAQTGFCHVPTAIRSVTNWKLENGQLTENDLTVLSCPGKAPLRIPKMTVCKRPNTVKYTYAVGIKPEHFDRLTSELRQSKDIEFISSSKQAGLLIIKTHKDSVISKLAKKPGVVFTEQEVLKKAPQKITSTSWNDLQISRSLNQIKVPEAWKHATGKGARILIIDSGADVNHPALQGKIEKVYNFIATEGDKRDVTDDVGHGTHVAGIAAGGSVLSPLGVAPEARILVAKVCDRARCSSTAIAQAMAWGLQEKVSVMNLSLGGGFTISEKFVLDKLDSAQIPVVAASGNSGMEGVSLPAAYPSVTAVGAVDANSQKSSYTNWGKELDVVAPGDSIVSSVPIGTGRQSAVALKLKMEDYRQVPSITFPLTPVNKVLDSSAMVYGKYGKEEELLGLDLQGKILVVDRGEITLINKIRNAESKMAVALVIVNNSSPLAGGSVTTEDNPLKIPAMMIEQQAGNALKEALANNQAAQISFEISQADYAEMTGTSMASPYVAGVVALMKSAKPRIGSYKIRQILTKTSSALPTSDANKDLPGLVNAEKAVIEALK